MPSISELFVELKLSADNFNNGLKEAQREAKEFEKNLKPTLTVTKELGTAMAASGALIVGGFAAASKAAVDYGDKLNDARQRTGATVETLAKLGFAAEQSGSSFEGLSTGVKFLSKNMEAAIAKSGDQRAAFNQLGISSKELADSHGDVNAVFLKLADRFKELPDGAEKSALAMKVFGKSGGDLIPLLNEGSAGIRKLGDDAEKAGLVISQDFASASDQLNDTLHKVEASAMGVAVGIAQSLLPTLQSAASLAADAGAKFADFSREHPVLIQATAALGAGLLTLGTALTAIAIIVPQIQAGIALLGGGMAVLSAVPIVALIAAIGALVVAYQLWSSANENLKKQLDEQDNSIAKAAKNLRDYGIQVDLAGKSEDEQVQALARAGKELKEITTFVGPLIDKTELLKRGTIDEAAAQKAHEEALKKAKEAAELAAKGFKIMLETRIQDKDLLPKVTKLQFEFNAALKAGGDAAVQAAADLGSFIAIANEAAASIRQASYDANEMQKDFNSITKADPGVQIGKGFDQSAEAIKKNKEEAEKLKTATDDIKKSAGHIFDDMFVKGESVFSSLGNALKGGVLSLGRAIFEDVTGALLGPIKKAFDDFFEGLLEGVGFKKFLSKLGNAIGDAISGAFGGGVSAAGSAAGSVGGGGSSAGSAASAGASSTVGTVAGVVGAVSSIIGNFQMARLEGTMNAVEFNTRATRIEIADMMDLILQPMLARLEDIKAELFNHKYVPDILTSIWEAIVTRSIAVPDMNVAPPSTGGSSTTGGTHNLTFNISQMPGQSGEEFARQIAEAINRYVRSGGGGLLATDLRQ